MKATSAPDTTTGSRAVAHATPTSGIAVPAVPSQLEEPAQEDISSQLEPATEEPLAQPLILNTEDNGEAEQHTLFINPADGVLWLHSDPEPLSLFLKRKRRKHGGVIEPLLVKIEAQAAIVYTGKYGTPTTRKNKKTKAGPKKAERQKAHAALTVSAGLLQQLNTIAPVAMKKQRPPSHLKTLNTKTIGSDTFCQLVIMEPLSLLPRDDGIVGSHPKEETGLWKNLTNIAGYKRGHMLNEHLHGPGTNDNLVPISTAFNARMRTGVEQKAKDEVNANNKVVRFEAESRNWGNYKGAFGFPEEKELPSTFYFKITQMKLIGGNDGSQISHWAVSTNVLYEETANHDIPTDVVPGVVAPVIKTLEPGIYYHPNGRIKPAPGSTNWLLLGNFNINNHIDFLDEPLALTAPGSLKRDSISETVLTEYAVKPGFQIENPFPNRKLEFIYNDTIRSIDTGSSTFIVFDPASRPALLLAFEKKKEALREAEKKQQQQVHDEKARQELEKKKLLAEIKFQQEQEKEKRQKDEDNRNYARSLYKQIWWECHKYEKEFNETFLELFHKHLRHVIDKHYAEWRTDTDLFGKKAATLLDPVRVKMQATVDKLLESQEAHEEKERRAAQQKELETGRRIADLKARLEKRVEDDFLPRLTERNAAQHFKGDADKIIRSYYKFWQDNPDKLKKPSGELLGSAVGKLEIAFARAEKLAAGPIAPFRPKRRLGEDEDSDSPEKEKEKDRQNTPPFKFQKTPSNMELRKSPGPADETE